MRLISILLITAITTFPGCSQVDKRISKIEKGLRTEWGGRHSVKMDIKDRMEYYHVPGISVAMINNFRIEWTREYGFIENGTLDAVTSQTLFQSGSIGKPVIATVALQLADQGILHLDADVNNLLKTWKVPVNSFTERTAVTLRQLLSHTAGVTLPGVIGYKTGESFPELDQILSGEPPANTPPITIDQVPGTQYRYSSGGFMIVQKLILDYIDAGKSFPEIIGERVFNPTGMSSSTFDNNSMDSANSVSSGHRANGVPIDGGWYNYPEMGMGVFWTTPSDMALFVIQVMNAYMGIQSPILSGGMARLMLNSGIEGQGLGFRVADDGKDLTYFYHRGATEGYQTFLVGYPERGQGVVIMTNGDNGYPLIQEILKSVSIEYRWVRGFYF